MGILGVFLAIAVVIGVALVWLGVDTVKAFWGMGALAVPTIGVIWLFLAVGWEIPVLIAVLTVSGLALTR